MLNYVVKAISSSKHVRAAAFVDQELKFVPEENYPGVTHLREEINRAFVKSNLLSIPHAEALSKIDDTGKTFRVLFIKTNTTIPYSSVFMRLDFGYMTDEIDSEYQRCNCSREQISECMH